MGDTFNFCFRRRKLLALAGMSVLLTPIGVTAADEGNLLGNVFQGKGSSDDFFASTLEAFDIAVLGKMLQNFYQSMLQQETVFNYLLETGDALLAPLLAPLVIICSGARLAQDMNNPEADIWGGIYATAAVILGLGLYRAVMAELTIATNALSGFTGLLHYDFKNTMQEIENSVVHFNQAKKNTDIIANLIDLSLSVYTEYFLAWGSKWGVMVLHALLNYLRNTLFAINYVLGIFILPFFIIRNSSLPASWVKITAFILLWAIVEVFMIAVMGQLGVAALNSATDFDDTLPIFSESLFYVMVATVNILVGAAMLSSIWIVKSYLLSPGSISAAAALFTLPAVSIAGMSAAMATRGFQASTSLARATLGGRGRHGKGKGGGMPGRIPLPDDIFGSGKKKSPPPSKKKPDSSSKDGDASRAPADPGRFRRAYRMRSIIEHSGRLNQSSLPGNVTAVSRVGKKHKVPRNLRANPRGASA